MIIELLKSFFDWFGYISSTIVIIGFIWGIIQLLRGIIPISIRAGRIKQNKIAIFADSNNYSELKASLDSTKLFRKGSFEAIMTPGNIAASEGSNIFVVHWADWENHIDDILSRKTSKIGLIIYAPFGHQVSPADMQKLQKHNFITLTNFRGRLITDLLAMAIAIRYARK